MFSAISLRGKLISSYVFCMLCLLIVGGAGYFGQQKTTASYSHVSDVIVPNLKSIGTIVSAIKDANVVIGTLAGTHSTAAEVAEQQKILNEIYQRLGDGITAYEKSPWGPGEEERWEALKKEIMPLKDLVTKILSMSASGNVEEDKARDDLIKTTYNDLNKKLDQGLDFLVDYQGKEGDKKASEAKEMATNSSLMIGIIMVLGFFLAMTFGLMISSSLSSTLRKIAMQLSTGADEVASASHQVAASSEELSSSTNEQAASLQETVASVEEMSAMIGKNAENAKNSQGVSSSSQLAAEKGKSAVSDMIQAMDEINSSNLDIMRQVELSNGQISDIVKVIAEIGNKTKVINDIVFQTKLLSFNASVEAARAGEHGKGFAVVAEEVGNLAQMSGAAAKEISSMLDGSIKKVEEIVSETKNKVEHLIRNGKSKIEKGTDVAKRCSTVLDEMVVSVSEVNRMVGEIAIASQEQATGVQQINQAMGQLDQVTQQNASASQETANAAELLTNQSTQLHAIVSELVRTVEGSQGKHQKMPQKQNDAEANVVSIDAKVATNASVSASSSKQAIRTPKSSLKSDVPSRDNVRFGNS